MNHLQQQYSILFKFCQVTKNNQIKAISYIPIRFTLILNVELLRYRLLQNTPPYQRPPTPTSESALPAGS